MSLDEISPKAGCSPGELDEAAVWIARLHAPDRARNVEVGFRRWLSESGSHAAAYEAISELWELTGALKRRPLPKPTRWERASFRAGFRRSAAVAAVAATLMLAGAIFYIHSRGVATDIGEQRVLTLDDGSRISLNTDSRVVIKYDTHQRRVELKSGEALFEVVKQPGRPFVVVARDRYIEALGTSFNVREDDHALAVTLVEGKVTVTPEGEGQDDSHPSSVVNAHVRAADRESQGDTVKSRIITQESSEGFTLSPGQRLTLTADRHARIDRPAVDKVTAWRNGRIELEDASLEDAAREMNRYTTVRLVVETQQTDTLRINGVFRAGDTAGFAAAVARSYGLTVERRPRQLVLRGIPSQTASLDSTTP